MKKTVCLLLLLCALVLTCACAEKKTVTTVVWSASDEAIAKRDAMVQAGGNTYFLEENFAPYWADILKGDAIPVPTFDAKSTVTVTQVMNQDVYTLSDGSYDLNVLYIHGGAWVYQIETVHLTFCDDLVEKLNAKVTVPIYDLAPNATFTDTVAFMKNVYQTLQNEGKPIVVMGDSAGGTISLDLIYALKADGIAMPSRLVLLAPCSDLSFSNPEMATIEPNDPNLAVYGCRACATLWAGEENLKNPAVSALYADVTGYPKTLIIQGTDDILSVDNYKLADKLCDAGVDVTLLKGEGLFHVFSVYPIPERAETLDFIRDFCR